jgi:hypothetical protein
MTLHTRIAVLDPVPLEELFAWVNSTLIHTRPDTAQYNREEEMFDLDHFVATGGQDGGERRYVPDNSGNWTMGNEMDQGYDAAFWIDYRLDGALHPEPLYYDADYEHTTEAVYWAPEDGADLVLHPASPAMVAELNFDTTYGYREGELGCGELHACYILAIGEWLSARGASMSWYNEFTGEWHPGTENLGGLVNSSFDARAWFHTMVVPAITKEYPGIEGPGLAVPADVVSS